MLVSSHAGDSTPLFVQDTKASIVRASAGVSVFYGLSAVLGVANQGQIAFLFGAGSGLDAYYAAMALPSLVAGIGLAAFGFIVVPALSARAHDHPTLRVMTSTVLLATVVTAAALSIAGFLAGGLIISAMAPALTGQARQAAILMARLAWLPVALSLVTSCLVAVHQAQRRFLLPAAITPLPQLGTLVGAALLARTTGPTSLIWGSIAAGSIQVTIMLASAAPYVAWKHANVSDLDRSSLIRGVLYVVFSLMLFTSWASTDTYWAGRLGEGAPSYLGYCQRIAVTLGGVLITGIAVVLFPYMAIDAANQAPEALRQRLTVGLRWGLLVMAPTGATAWIVLWIVAKQQFAIGAWNADTTTGLLRVLPYYLVGMVPMSLMSIVVRGYFAEGRGRQAAVLGLTGSVGYFVLAGSLAMTIGSATGIGLAYVIYWNVTLVVAAALLKWKFWTADIFVFSLKLLLAVTAGLTTWGMLGYLIGGRVGPLAPLWEFVPAVGVFWLCAAWGAPIEEAVMFQNAMWRWGFMRNLAPDWVSGRHGKRQP